jgi:hypothetical protein
MDININTQVDNSIQVKSYMESKIGENKAQGEHRKKRTVSTPPSEQAHSQQEPKVSQREYDFINTLYDFCKNSVRKLYDLEIQADESIKIFNETKENEFQEILRAATEILNQKAEDFQSLVKQMAVSQYCEDQKEMVEQEQKVMKICYLLSFLTRNLIESEINSEEQNSEEQIEQLNKIYLWTTAIINSVGSKRQNEYEEMLENFLGALDRMIQNLKENPHEEESCGKFEKFKDSIVKKDLVYREFIKFFQDYAAGDLTRSEHFLLYFNRWSLEAQIIEADADNFLKFIKPLDSACFGDENQKRELYKIIYNLIKIMIRNVEALNQDYCGIEKALNE